MAGTTVTQGAQKDETRQQHNNAVLDLEALRAGLAAQGAVLNALIVDVAAVRTKFIAALAKLDADAGVTDTNYAATETPNAMTAAAVTLTTYDAAGDMIAAKVSR